MKQKQKPWLVKPKSGFSHEYVIDTIRKFLHDKRLAKFCSEPTVVTDTTGRPFIQLFCHERVAGLISKIPCVQQVATDNWTGIVWNPENEDQESEDNTRA